MKITDRVRFAIKAFSAPLGNSVNGAVVRNFINGGDFNPTQQLRGITYKAVDKIGGSLSAYQPKVVKGQDQFYENHPLYNLFENPNPIQRSSTDFQHLYGMLMQIYGETFWYLARGENTGKIKEIYLLNPSQMQLQFSDGELIGYIMHKSNGQQVPFELDEIYHDKTPNPFNEWRGMSIVERASQYIDIELVSTSFTLNYMRNSGSPSGIVSLPEMEKEAFKQFTAQWRESYEGPQNAGKTAFIRGGQAEFKAVGATLQDIDQEITRKMAKEDVFLMLGVPKPLLGGTDDNGFGRANIEALTYIYMSETINPLMIRLDKIYSVILSMQPGRATLGGDKKVTHISPVPDDKEFNLAQNKALVNVAVTVNEVRKSMGLPPIPGGDDLQPDNKVTAPSGTGKAAKTIIRLKKAVSKADLTKAEAEGKEQFRAKLEGTNAIYSAKMKREMATFATKQETEVIDKINASSKSYDEWLPNIQEASNVLGAALAEVVVELMEAQSVDVANFITGELLTITPDMRKSVEINMKQVAGVYNTDTIKALQTTLSQGQAAGESLAKLKKRVESVYGDAKGYRAERIARTESGHASNRTAELVYADNGYSEVEWFINPGACEFCRTFAGRTKSIGSNFNSIGDVITGDEGNKLRLEYANIDTPPLHPNCTCSLVPSGGRLSED